MNASELTAMVVGVAGGARPLLSFTYRGYETHSTKVKQCLRVAIWTAKWQTSVLYDLCAPDLFPFTRQLERQIDEKEAKHGKPDPRNPDQ